MKTLQERVSVSLDSHQRVTRSTAYLFDGVQVLDVLLLLLNDFAENSGYLAVRNRPSR